MLRALDSGSDEPVNVRFGEASRDLLTDFLTHLNTQNKEKLHTLPACCGSFKDRRLMECILLMTKELRLDPLVGYHAIEMLQRFMLKHLAGLLAPPTPEGRSDGPLVPQLQQKFPLLVFSCLQLSSKLLLHSHRINNETAVHFLHSVGCEVSRQAVLEAELLVCRELHFALHAPDPLTFVETLLEVLGHNVPSVPLVALHRLSLHVLQFVTLQRSNIFQALLAVTTCCARPSAQLSRFLTVTEDFMLLAVGVVATASFVLSATEWKQIVEELSNITGISRRSVCDFAHVTLTHLVQEQVEGTASL
ncbi:cyclin N-terminal domain-containing protein 1 isoform X4 [Nelusetta ayraudi]|uniref:cyclin N-terminal domain-containing protein 1 isoform X4 n=1 Tax=Nelusetta ayraudi TaxID=303726 RepID=UPI003F70633B